MAKFRLSSIAQLARELEFAPQDLRGTQLARAEDLLHLIDPAKGYPLDFIIFKITEYRRKDGDAELLTGLALQHDLGLMIERVSLSLDLMTSRTAEPVLSIEDVCAKFNVTSKTIQRWRRKGLPARRFIYPDGKRRVGFLLSSVERFLAKNQDQVSANLTQMEDGERDVILRHARRLAEHGTEEEITRRIARRLGRSPLTILHTIRKYDAEHPEQAVLALARHPLSDRTRAVVVQAFKRGTGLSEIARKIKVCRSEIYRIVMDERISRLSRRKMRFFDDSLFHQEDAADAIRQIVSQEELAASPTREELRVPRDLPPYLQDLYRTPLLTPGKERALFLKLNFHKYQFVRARRRIDPELVRSRDLRELERHLSLVGQTKNDIVRANLRLVVSIARKHVRPGVGLLDLVSEGNIILMRAVDSFDVGRGFRFSTYATLSLMKGFARAVPQMLSAMRKSEGDPELLKQVPDGRLAAESSGLLARDEVGQLLSRLDERERSVVAAHFGLEQGIPETYEQVGQRLGLSKERVRQIEQLALAKLRAIAHPLIP